MTRRRIARLRRAYNADRRVPKGWSMAQWDELNRIANANIEFDGNDPIWSKCEDDYAYWLRWMARKYVARKGRRS